LLPGILVNHSRSFRENLGRGNVNEGVQERQLWRLCRSCMEYKVIKLRGYNQEKFD